LSGPSAVAELLVLSCCFTSLWFVDDLLDSSGICGCGGNIWSYMHCIQWNS